MNAAAETFAFDAESRAKADYEIAKYPAGRQASAVMALLDIAQRQNGGWLHRAAIEHVADVLGMAAMRVLEVATFYTMYNLQPIGRHHVQVCTNLPCWLRGSDEIMAACRDTLGIDVGETTRDGLFSLSEVECLGACVNAPMAQIDDDYYEDLDAGSTQSVLEQFIAGETPAPGPRIDRKGCEPIGGLTTLTGADGTTGDD